jgi:hypothetical protein
MLPETVVNLDRPPLTLEFLSHDESGLSSGKRSDLIEIGTQYGPFDEVGETRLGRTMRPCPFPRGG